MPGCRRCILRAGIAWGCERRLGRRLRSFALVEDHDVARLEGREEELFDIGVEALVVDRPVEQAMRDAGLRHMWESGPTRPP